MFKELFTNQSEFRRTTQFTQKDVENLIYETDEILDSIKKKTW